MAKNILVLLLVISISGCSASKSGKKTGDSRTVEVDYIDDNAFRLTIQSTDKSYGYTQSNPVKVGGARENSGPRNERRFLNGLCGPNKEVLRYYRAGSCCPFNTPNGMFGNSGMLDIYKVYWTGGSDTLTIYINMYDKGNLEIPVGFTARTE